MLDVRLDCQKIASKAYINNKKDRVANATLLFLLVATVGLEPIAVQVSGGHLLAPVQKLVPTSIFSFR